MSQYNIEFFDHTLTNLHHDSVDSLEDLDDDALAADATELTIARVTTLTNGNIVWIGGDTQFLGIISSVNNEGEDNTSIISVKPFNTLFDGDVLIDTDSQNSTALETVIANAIKDNWINSGDSVQDWTIFTVTTTSSTTSWSFNLKSDTTDQHYKVCNLYSDIMAKALSKYGIAVNFKIDFSEKKIAISIGTVSGTKTIEADLDNVKVETFKYHDYGGTTNKLIVYNSSGYSEKVVYYLHTDGTYTTTDSDRITPVKLSTTTATSSDSKTFSEAAKESAENTFDGIEYEDLIELSLYSGDELIQPMEMNYGQICNVIHDGKQYETIFTGRKFTDNIVTLMFGTIRAETTKQARLS